MRGGTYIAVGVLFAAVIAGAGIREYFDHGGHAGHNAHADAPREAGQGAFAALSETARILESEAADWSRVDMDALWSHLQDMNALLLHTSVDKETLADGLAMKVTGGADAARAMREMIPAHSEFLASVRPDWDIQFAPIENGENGENGYLIRVTSPLPDEVEKIQGLGFSGFMVQDDHHAAHHLAIASDEQVHAHTAH